MEIEKTEEIQLKHLLAQRSEIIKKVINSEIDETFFRRKTLMQNKTKEDETALVNAQQTLRNLNEVLQIIDTKIKELTK